MDKVLLEDVCYILDNKRVPITECDRKKGPYPYYGANGVQDYVDDYIFDDELVLLAEDGGNFGSKEKPIAYRVSGKCWVNNHAHVLKPKENINVNYLCYSLMFYDVSGFVNGATRQKLTQSNMRQMLIPFCSLAEQQRIADELDKVSELIEKRQKQLEKLDLLIKSRFVEMFGGTEKSTYKQSTFGEEFIVSSGGTPSTQNPEYWNNGEISWIGSNLCQNIILHKNDGKFITESGLKHSSAKVFDKNTILIALVGATIGKVALLKFQTAINQNIAGIVIKDSKIFSSYYVFYSAMALYPLFMKLGGDKFKMANLSFIRQLPIMVPPIELQNQFADFVEKVEQNKSKIKNSLDKLITLKKALMQKYFG